MRSHSSLARPAIHTIVRSLLIFGSAISGLQAASLTWDPNLTPLAPTAGSGAWNTSTANWSNGSSDVSWTNANDDTAIFNNSNTGTAWTVTLGTPITVGALTFNTGSDSYTIAGSTLTFAGATPTITVNPANGGGGLIISSTIAGNQGLTITGSASGSGTVNAGKITLSASNTFSGGLVVSSSGGSAGLDLVVSNTSALGSGNVVIGSGVQLDGASSGTIANNFTISGLGSILNGSRGALVSENDTNFSGSITLAAAAGIGSVNGGGIFSGNISGAYGLTFNIASSADILSGTNSYTTTSIERGTLQIGNGGTAGTLGSGNVSLGTNSSGTSSLVFDRSDNFVVANNILQGNVTGTNSLVKEGAGTLTLSGSNTYTGLTTITAGTLEFTQNNSGSSTIGVAVNNAGSTLAVNYGGASDFTAAQVVTLLAKTTFGATTTAFAFDTTNLSGTYANNLTMAAGLTKLGANTLTLSGSNTYTGATTVSAGTLLIAAGGSISNGTINVKGGSFIANGVTGAGTVTVGTGALIGGSGTIGGSVSLNSGASFMPGSTPSLLTISGSLTLNGTATMEITNASARGSSYSASNIGGMLDYGGSLTLDLTGAGTNGFANGTIFDLFSAGSVGLGNLTSISIAGAGSPYAGLTFSLAGSGSTGLWTSTVDGSGQYLTFSQATGDLNVAAVPEPQTWALFGVSLAGGILLRLRRTRRAGVK